MINGEKYMYVVSFVNRENKKETLFATDVLQTATSFIHNFGNEINELQQEYMQECYRKVKEPNIKLQEWYDKINSLTDRMNMHITNKKSFSDMVTEVNYGLSIEYEKVKLL